MSTIDGILAPFGVVLFVTVVILLSYFFARRRQDTDPLAAGASAPSDHDTTDGEDDDREHGLDEATILSYPRLQYSKAARDIDADDGSSSSCSICLSDYWETDTVRVLSECRHFFHVSCVDPWLKLHSTCPICRKLLLGAPDGSGWLKWSALLKQGFSSRFTLFIRWWLTVLKVKMYDL